MEQPMDTTNATIKYETQPSVPEFQRATSEPNSETKLKRKIIPTIIEPNQIERARSEGEQMDIEQDQTGRISRRKVNKYK
jgi:hypothetical protein